MRETLESANADDYTALLMHPPSWLRYCDHELFRIPVELVKQVKAIGFWMPTSAELEAWWIRRFEAGRQRYYGQPHRVIEAIGAGLFRGATLGFSEIAADWIDPNGLAVTLFNLSDVNRYTSLASTFVGFVLLVVTVRWLQRRRRRRERERFDRDRPDVQQPDGRPEVAGSFVTRDGYEYIVMRHTGEVYLVPPVAGEGDLAETERTLN